MSTSTIKHLLLIDKKALYFSFLHKLVVFSVWNKAKSLGLTTVQQTWGLDEWILHDLPPKQHQNLLYFIDYAFMCVEILAWDHN